jgi:hypothetical protein
MGDNLFEHEIQIGGFFEKESARWRDTGEALKEVWVVRHGDNHADAGPRVEPASAYE